MVRAPHWLYGMLGKWNNLYVTYCNAFLFNSNGTWRWAFLAEGRIMNNMMVGMRNTLGTNSGNSRFSLLALSELKFLWNIQLDRLMLATENGISINVRLKPVASSVSYSSASPSTLHFTIIHLRLVVGSAISCTRLQPRPKEIGIVHN